jgi:pilus assembly protein CpaF
VPGALLGLGGLQRLLDDPRVENIDVNGCDRGFVRYADGRTRQPAPVAACDAELAELIRTVAARAGAGERCFDRADPRLTVQLPDGSRLFAVMAVTRRPCISVRRHRHTRITLGQLLELGTAGHALAGFLSAAVRAHKNILVSGGTSIGKTTLPRALAAEIPPGERLVTIEDTCELDLVQLLAPSRLSDHHSSPFVTLASSVTSSGNHFVRLNAHGRCAQPGDAQEAFS